MHVLYVVVIQTKYSQNSVHNVYVVMAGWAIGDKRQLLKYGFELKSSLASDAEYFLFIILLLLF